jgi:glycosyltransferase involved in cell wall biosynthesis
LALPLLRYPPCIALRYRITIAELIPRVMSSRTLPVSILILTLNEELHLPACLASVAGADDIVVLDSGSTDRTTEIARTAGARVFVHPFTDFGSQRNYAHATISFRHPWVFHLDPDEQMMPELLTECAGLSADVPFDGYYVAPRMMFHGRWLKRCTDYPAWQARCVQATGFRFIQVGHEQRESPNMRMSFLRNSYLIDISAPDIAEWEAKHRSYARKEAVNSYTERFTVGHVLRSPFPKSALERRRTLKHLSYAMPFRPQLRFLYQYIVRGGFLDGPGAFRYCCLLARYEKYVAEEISKVRQERNG